MAIPISWAKLALIAEKIVRGCEYKLNGRFLEAPYGIRVFVSSSDFVPQLYLAAAQFVNFGPGCNVRRVFATEDPNVVLYWLSISHPRHWRDLAELVGVSPWYLTSKQCSCAN